MGRPIYATVAETCNYPLQSDVLHSNDRLLRALPTTYGRPTHDHSTLTSDALDASDAVFRRTLSFLSCHMDLKVTYQIKLLTEIERDVNRSRQADSQLTNVLYKCLHFC